MELRRNVALPDFAKGLLASFNGSGSFPTVVKSRFQKLLGNGSLIWMWDDIWVVNGRLKDLFPRIFALAVNKSGMVNEFGLWLEDT